MKYKIVIDAYMRRHPLRGYRESATIELPYEDIQSEIDSITMATGELLPLLFDRLSDQMEKDKHNDKGTPCRG